VEVVRGHRQAPSGRAVVAIGNFDGVHVGHRALVRRAVELARQRGAHPVALTFDPHPQALLSPRGAPPQLASLARRIELLGEAGAEVVVVEPFTPELAELSAEAFVDDLVIDALHADAIVVGYDFAYGHSRAGTTESLRRHGEQRGVATEVIAKVTVAGEVASSSRIRGHLEAGELAAAERLLGRRWDIDGIVVRGAQRGRAIGVPTANIRPDADLLIIPGIYAVTLCVDRGPALRAVASLGTNPTFVTDGRLVLEVHVLDFEGDLFDRRVRTAFAARLRDETRFDSVDQLVAQMRCDIAEARRIL
jgi:riboflavin kinase/FMN adenylyltransferase